MTPGEARALGVSKNSSSLITRPTNGRETFSYDVAGGSQLDEEPMEFRNRGG
jgi:hypothetical protein